jgi:hypothetical protein
MASGSGFLADVVSTGTLPNAATAAAYSAAVAQNSRNLGPGIDALLASLPMALTPAAA